ncbi:hypothetical protein PoB_006219400 [Plakobranchus ocellatus]|uniref:Uncharacterized protein n=1 Tax=Plakobranchus ocellatus TaxID=259542 RepID=A0AAV4CUV3_9GAST|nr:hypothetical protein PoB_006219400 [Plakobranchus ocellatus]
MSSSNLPILSTSVYNNLNHLKCDAKTSKPSRESCSRCGPALRSVETVTGYVFMVQGFCRKSEGKFKTYKIRPFRERPKAIPNRHSVCLLDLWQSAFSVTTEITDKCCNRYINSQSSYQTTVMPLWCKDLAANRNASSGLAKSTRFSKNEPSLYPTVTVSVYRVIESPIALNGENFLRLSKNTYALIAHFQQSRTSQCFSSNTRQTEDDPGGGGNEHDMMVVVVIILHDKDGGGDDDDASDDSDHEGDSGDEDGDDCGGDDDMT